MLNGWQTRTAQELDATIHTWDEVISGYKIPLDAYPELYKRAFDTRQIALRNGKEPPSFDVTLLISQWTGEYGLASEWRKRDIASGRFLETNAASDCDICFGSGFETTPKGARKCGHGNA